MKLLHYTVTGWKKELNDKNMGTTSFVFTDYR